MDLSDAFGREDLRFPHSRDMGRAYSIISSMEYDHEGHVHGKFLRKTGVPQFSTWSLAQGAPLGRFKFKLNLIYLSAFGCLCQNAEGGWNPPIGLFVH